MVKHVNRSNQETPNKSGRLGIRLDKETLSIWNRRKRSGENMNEWVRRQLQYHFGGVLSPEQRLAMLHEELLLLQSVRDEKMMEYEREIIRKQQDYVRTRAEVEEEVNER